MKKSLIRASYALFLSMLTFAGQAQEAPVKFGKISMEQMEAEFCPIDSNAHAYYIFDYGYSYFKYATTKVTEGDVAASQKGFQLIHNRHFRIKILDNQGYDWADIGIPLYHDQNTEKVGVIKAVTYNLEDGKIVKTKLNKSDVHVEETSAHWNQRKFAMPNVKEGSILEVEYTIISDYLFNLREWLFQTTIPVLRSEYYVHIPEYYTYNQTHKGYFPISTESGQKRKTITIAYTERPDYKGSTTHTSSTDYLDKTFFYSASDVPAFPQEDFLRTRDNYLTKVEFELNRINYPSLPPKNYTSTWTQVDENLTRNSSFGGALSKDAHLEGVVASLKVTGEEGLPLLEAAYEMIREKLAWNKQYSKYVTGPLSKTYKEEQGNAADINLNLVVLLRSLGFESYPVILSTQQNGIIHPSHPSLSSFNFVIALARVEGETYLMDATDPNAGINLLPLRCLNDRGRVIGSPDLEWVGLMDYRQYKFRSDYTLSFTEDMGIVGSRLLVLNDYALYNYRRKIKGFNNLEEYEESVDKNNEEIHISNLVVEGLDSANNELRILYDLEQVDFVEDAADILYFSPVFHPFYESNPFKLEKRDYPVEFNYPYLIKQNYSITLPEGYTVSELPKAAIVKLPDNSAKYIYKVVQSGNILMVYTSMSIKKSNYLPEEYENIKQFFQMVINKQNELIVLRKS